MAEKGYDAEMLTDAITVKPARYRGPPKWRVIATKDGNGFTAALRVSKVYESYGIIIQRPNTVTTFVGQAVFPDSMGKIAAKRFDALEDDNDIDALLREFGTDTEYDGFMEFRVEDALHDDDSEA